MPVHKKYFSGQKGTALFLNPGKRGRKNVYDINIKILTIFSAVLFKNQDIWECRPHALLFLYPVGFVLKTASAIETFDTVWTFFFWFNKCLYACGLCRLRSKIINSLHRFFLIPRGPMIRKLKDQGVAKMNPLIRKYRAPWAACT